MANTVTWDTSFEADPADSAQANNGANEIRRLKLAISERLEEEMNFMAGTVPLLKAGIAAVCYSGNQTEISALSDPSDGALAYNSNTETLQRCESSNWANLTIKHSSLSNLTDADDHTQYLKLDKEGQTLSANLTVAANVTIDGVDIDAHTNANLTTEHSGGILGSWSDSGEYVTGANYTANTDGIITATGLVTTAPGSVSILSPSTVAKVINSANLGYVGAMCVVKKDDTWRVDMINCSANGIIYFIPLGS